MRGHVIPSVSKKTWLDLYQASFKFYEIAPWRWMWDSDIFGVQNPETGEIGYCCVLGAEGVCYGLAVYRGTEGLNLIRRFQNDEIEPEETLFVQDSLLLEFVPKKMFDKHDRNLVKNLGLTRSKQSLWPHFRNHVPGYYPWYLTEEEAHFLTLVIQQACLLTVQFKKSRAGLEPDQPNQILVSVPHPGKTGPSLRWDLLPHPPIRKDHCQLSMKYCSRESLAKVGIEKGVGKLVISTFPLLSGIVIDLTLPG